jgi:hypothetical protein
MKFNVNFTVVHRAFPEGYVTYEAFVKDERVFSAIQDIAFNHLNAPSHHPHDIAISAPVGDPNVEKIFTLLASVGWSPYFGEYVPEELRSTHFWVRRIGTYEKGDKDKCDYLRLSRWGLGEDLFDFNCIRDGLYCANVKGARWKARYGSGYNQHLPSAYFVNGEFKHALEAENLVGLAFKPVLFDKPEKARGEFWQMTSTVTMPPCLLPVLTIPNTPHIPNTPRLIIRYDGAGQSPLELVFAESAVRKIEPFDVALTREYLYPEPGAWAYLFVVSQRFRQVAHKLKLSTVDFVPVRLK